MARADQLDAEFRAATTLAEKTEETVRDLQKKMQHVENELDITLEKLTQTTTKLDEKEKAYAVAEGEIQALKRKIALLEDELERSDSKGTITSKELSEASALADSINKAIKVLETKNMIDEQRIEISENQLKEAKQMVEESDIKYDEVARKLAMVEGDLRRATERDEAMNKIVDLAEELRVIGESLKALEVAEEKAQQREEEYKKQIKTLLDRLKSAEGRAEYGEKTVQKLNLRIDSIITDLVTEKMKTQNVNDELDQTFALFVNPQ